MGGAGGYQRSSWRQAVASRDGAEAWHGPRGYRRSSWRQAAAWVCAEEVSPSCGTEDRWLPDTSSDKQLTEQ